MLAPDLDHPSRAAIGPPGRGLRLAAMRAIAAWVSGGALTAGFGPNGSLEISAAGGEASVRIARWRALVRLLVGGDVGFAEAYMDGDWSSPDLVAALRFAAHAKDRFEQRLRGAWPARMIGRARHRLRGNTRRGSRRNIAAHYDLGNAFFAHWLDAGMTYSSALFALGAQTLEAAQAEKERRVAQLLSLSGSERVLEIGCGWGGLAEHLARNGAGHVTAITISGAQYEYAASRLAALGPDRIELRLQDYRDVTGAFDRIASVEMIEAVGEAYWPVYFATLRDRLKPGGVAVLQAITIADDRFETYRRGTDFIQRYIFPGGLLPSPKRLREQIERAGLLIERVESFGDSYARTLSEWRRRFLAAWPAVADLGYSDNFRRMWEFYLAYCEAGFRESVVDVGLFRIRKPEGAR